MPGLDGWEVLQKVRLSGKDVPVLFLTARDRVEVRVKVLELGADDYLIKPFAFSELLARVRMLLRRGNNVPSQTLMKIADLEVDLLKRRAIRGGKRIDLTAKEFALLELLLRHRGEVLPKSLIASQVWGMNFDSDTNVIEVAVRRLRAKIDDDFEVKLIQTSRGMGYMLDAPDLQTPEVQLGHVTPPKFWTREHARSLLKCNRTVGSHVASCPSSISRSS